MLQCVLRKLLAVTSQWLRTKLVPCCFISFSLRCFYGVVQMTYAILRIVLSALGMLTFGMQRVSVKSLKLYV